jgi:hypothetical protein
MRYEVFEHPNLQDHWHVEAKAPEGLVFVAIFSGPKAQERAIEWCLQFQQFA